MIRLHYVETNYLSSQIKLKIAVEKTHVALRKKTHPTNPRKLCCASVKIVIVKRSAHQNKINFQLFAMDFQSYNAKLVNHKIFKDVKDSLQDNRDGKLRNLIDLRDEVLYVWNSVENCLLSLNVKRLEESDEETPYQVC